MSAGSVTRANREVCFIGGAGHSGSTLLGLVLGAHPAIFYAGEARKSVFLGDLDKPLKKRVCKLCGPDCPVWGTLRPSAETDLYEQLSRRTGRPVVVDSTKSTDWHAAQLARLAGTGARTTLLYLFRDGRAVVNSRVRKYPSQSPRDIIEAWRAQIERTDALAARFPGRVLHVRYEALASDPEPTVRRIADALGVAYDSCMLRFWESEQHPLGGNNGTQYLVARERAAASRASVVELGERTRAYYGEHPRGIVLDLRWKRELDPSVLALFDELAGELNRRFAWPEGEPEPEVEP
ncbi:MAG: hypothetical protein OHK0013_34720 [Sandaracinaceae bacterium]